MILYLILYINTLLNKLMVWLRGAGKKIPPLVDRPLRGQGGGNLDLGACLALPLLGDSRDRLDHENLPNPKGCRKEELGFVLHWP